LSDKFIKLGYNTYARNFGVAQIGGFNDEKDINILVSAIIEDMYDATGDEQFEDKPFVLILETHAYPEFWSDEYAENIKDMVGDDTINPRTIDYLSDAHSYGLGVPLSTDAQNKFFKTEKQALDFYSDKFNNITRQILSFDKRNIGYYGLPVFRSEKNDEYKKAINEIDRL
jgi:hypothetical protein